MHAECNGVHPASSGMLMSELNFSKYSAICSFPAAHALVNAIQEKWCSSISVLNIRLDGEQHQRAEIILIDEAGNFSDHSKLISKTMTQ